MTSLPYLSRKSKFNRHHAIGHKHTQTRESSYKILECKLVSDHWRTRKHREETGRLQARWQFEQSAPPATHSDREPEPLRQCSHNQDPSWRGCTAPWQKSLQGNVMWLLQMHHHQVQWYQRSWRVRILFLRLKFKLSNTRTQQKAKAQLDIGIPHEEIWFRSEGRFLLVSVSCQLLMLTLRLLMCFSFGFGKPRKLCSQLCSNSWNGSPTSATPANQCTAMHSWKFNELCWNLKVNRAPSLLYVHRPALNSLVSSV